MIDSMLARIDPKVRAGLLLTAVLLLVLWYLGPLQLLIRGATNGKIAKFEFSLKDDIAVTTMVWSPDGKYIATSTNQGGALHIWDVQKRKRILEFERSWIGLGGDLSWSPDGQYLVACENHGTEVRVFRALNWSQSSVLRLSSQGCGKTAFSSDSSELAVLSGDGVIFYSVSSWKETRFVNLQKTMDRGDLVRAIKYVPGTHIVLLGGDDRVQFEAGTLHDGAIWILRPEDETPSRRIWAYTSSPEELPGDVRALAVSPSGLQVATGATTGAGGGARHAMAASLHVFNIANDSLVAAPLDNLGYSQAAGLAYTRDGRYLIIGHGNIHGRHPVHLIDARTYQVVDTVRAWITIYDVDSSPDGKQFAVAAGDHVYIWSLKSPG